MVLLCRRTQRSEDRDLRSSFGNPTNWIDLQQQAPSKDPAKIRPILAYQQHNNMFITTSVSGGAISASADAPLCLADLPDELLQLMLPQQSGAASTCHRFRTLVLTHIQTIRRQCRSVETTGRLDEALAYMEALPCLAQVVISGDRECLQGAVSSCGPLSGLVHLTKFEMTPEREMIRNVRHQPVLQPASQHVMV
jgi:hypothetical protein